MATIADLITTLDSAASPISAALKANGPVYLNSDGGAIWLLTFDSREFAGFRATPVQKASNVTVAETPSTPTTPA